MSESETERELRNRKECAVKKLKNALKNCHLIRVCVKNHYRRESSKNCKLIIPLEMADKSKSSSVKNPGLDTTKIPSLKFHGKVSSRQPTAESRVISAEIFPSILFDWPEFFDSEFISILTRADEILSCIIDALEGRIYIAIITLGDYFSHYAFKNHTSNEILFMEHKMVIPLQLRAPIMARIHRRHALVKMRDVANS